jgi:hypothetical protein
MFTNRTFKQKLSYTKNDSTDDIVTINIVLSTNHEINESIISDISGVICQMFIQDYTNTDDLIQRQKEAKQADKEMKEKAKDELRLKKEQDVKAKHDAKEIIKMQKENDKRVADEKKDFDKRVKEETIKLKAKVVEKKPDKPKHWQRKKR